MPVKQLPYLLCVLAIWVLAASCSPGKKLTSRYYYKHEQVLNQIEQSYTLYYAQQPFSMAFTDDGFSMLTIEIKTDSLTYIYQFEADAPRLQDTLRKYGMHAPGITGLVKQMQSIQCIWINQLDYYTDDKKKFMVFISIKPKKSSSPFAYKKYYILSYFAQKQYFDDAGRLLVKKKLRKVHTINGDIFRRINDKICYAASGKFR